MKLGTLHKKMEPQCRGLQHWHALSGGSLQRIPPICNTVVKVIRGCLSALVARQWMLALPPDTVATLMGQKQTVKKTIPPSSRCACAGHV
jgi:hypothetical protein